MRQVKKDDGKRQFLSQLLIGSYFSRLVLQKRRADNNLYTEDYLLAEPTEHDFQELMMAA